MWWSLPAAAVAALFTAVPLPGQQQQLAAAAAVPAGSSNSSSEGDADEQRADAVYDVVKRMSRNDMLAKSLPIE